MELDTIHQIKRRGKQFENNKKILNYNWLSVRKFKLTKGNLTITWLNTYKHDFADPMSNKQEFHLPIETQKIAIYEKYRKDLKKEGNGDYIVDYSYFIKMWRSYHPDLKNAKKSRFGQCGTCSKQVAIINSLPKSNPESIRTRKERVPFNSMQSTTFPLSSKKKASI